jgi:mannose-6-phosphate isomerase-like protein (cupin superfamily)
MKDAKIIHSDENQEYYFQEGCYILELSNSENDSELSIAKARVVKDTSTKLHALSNTIERYIILEGKGEVILGDQSPQEVTKGDIVIIPADCPQAIKNTGENDLVFLVICTPRFIESNYREL